jgi:hypothetical protein
MTAFVRPVGRCTASWHLAQPAERVIVPGKRGINAPGLDSKIADR